MVALSTHNTLELPDGRVLGYAEYGHPDGEPVLYFHGVPGSRLSGLLPGVLAAPRRGRVIAVDRPGYGLSTFQRRRKILDWPDDVEALADHLGLDRFGVMGYSGGGPYAAACAYRLPERVAAVAIISGMGPLMTPAAARTLTPFQKVQHFMVRHSPLIVDLGMKYVSGRVVADPEQYLVRRDGRTPDCDRAVMARPTIRAVMKEDLVEAFAQGSRAAVHDVKLLAGKWGFSLSDLAVPVHLWHGEHDPVVPPWLGRQVAEAIPECSATFVPDAGHMLFVDCMDEVLDVLIDARKARDQSAEGRRALRLGLLRRTA